MKRIMGHGTVVQRRRKVAGRVAPCQTPTVVVHDELCGLWDSRLFGYGAMESSTVALLADGSGWATWSSVSRSMELLVLAWDIQEPNLLVLNELELVDGVTAPVECS